MTGGILIAGVGVWVLFQVLGGDALRRLRVIGGGQDVEEGGRRAPWQSGGEPDTDTDDTDDTVRGGRRAPWQRGGAVAP